MRTLSGRFPCDCANRTRRPRLLVEILVGPRKLDQSSRLTMTRRGIKFALCSSKADLGRFARFDRFGGRYNKFVHRIVISVRIDYLVNDQLSFADSDFFRWERDSRKQLLAQIGLKFSPSFSLTPRTGKKTEGRKGTRRAS